MNSLAKIESLYTPSPWGIIYHYTPGIDFLLGAGAAGPGKSWVLAADWMTQAIYEHERCEGKHPEAPLEWGRSTGFAIYLRRERTQTVSVRKRMELIVNTAFPDSAWDGKNEIWTLPSGFQVGVGSCKDPNDWQNYRSQEFTWIGFDEATQFTEEQFHEISSRIRTGDEFLAKHVKVRLMSNPENDSWVKRMFVTPAPLGKRILKRPVYEHDVLSHYETSMYLPATIDDNPNPTIREKYKRLLLGKPKHIRDALLYGSWDVVRDGFFQDDWVPSVHVCRRFDIPEEWPMFRSMDWGFKSPGCVHWWAMNPDGNLFCVRELTFQNKWDSEVAELILKTERGLRCTSRRGGKLRSILNGPADTQLWEKRGEMRVVSKAERMAELGVPWTQADKRSRKRNIELLLERMRSHKNGSCPPGFVVFDCCTQLIRTLPTRAVDPTDPDVPKDGGEDHWLDSACYACAWAQRGPGCGTKRVSDRDGHYYTESDERVDEPDRGSSGYGF